MFCQIGSFPQVEVNIKYPVSYRKFLGPSRSILFTSPTWRSSLHVGEEECWKHTPSGKKKFLLGILAWFSEMCLERNLGVAPYLAPYDGGVLDTPSSESLAPFRSTRGSGQWPEDSITFQVAKNWAQYPPILVEFPRFSPSLPWNIPKQPSTNSYMKQFFSFKRVVWGCLGYAKQAYVEVLLDGIIKNTT